MSQKILVADDSATIQKVVSITLANEKCELVEVLDSDTMFQNIEEEYYSIVLLDFNLSETMTGYELSKKIKNLSPNTYIIGMLGTFDTVDNTLLDESGVEEVVVKPFESTKFIQSCRRLLELTANTREESLPQSTFDDVANVEVEEFSSENSDYDTQEEDLAEGWVTKSPDIYDSSQDEFINHDEEELVSSEEIERRINPLQEQLEGWGMEVPAPIDHPEVIDDFLPPQIDISEVSASEVESELTMPTMKIDMSEFTEELKSHEGQSSVDISNPNIDVNFSISDSLESKNQDADLEPAQRKPMFHSMDDLSQEDVSEVESLQNDNEKTQEISIEEFDLEKEIEEESPENFWAVDEENGLYATPTKDEEAEIIKFGPQGNSSGIANLELSESDKDDIVNRLTERVREMLVEVVKEYCETKVDAVAWEVIPDLAENLIKKEIQELSDSVK